jgi:VWFA-related protein
MRIHPVGRVARPAPIAVVAAALLAAGLLAQAPPAGQEKPPQQPPATAAPQVPRPTFKSGIDLVTTDVIVRDGRGQFVADLKPSDFEIFEDGVKQQVVQLVLFHGGRQYVPLAAPPPPSQEGIVLPPPRPTNDSAGRIFVFFVDDLHLDFRNTGRIRELFKKIRTSLVHEGDMFACVSTGPSSIEIDMTYDLKRLDDAMKKIAGNGLRPADILEGGSTTEGPSEVRYRAHVAFATAYDMVSQLELVHNRRKALIYVSNGYDFNPFPGSRYKAEQDRMGNPGSNNSADPTNTQAYLNAADDPSDLFSRQGQVFAEADLARELAELTRAANRANVSFYTIDPRGLVGMPDMDETVDQTEWQDYIRKSQDSLIVLANETGGYAVVNSNDFDKALKRIDAETSDYYVLGYYSNNPDPLKRNRRIEVKLTRTDLNVWSRKGYSLRSTKNPK